MIAKDENLLVKLVKKAIGLPIGNSACSCSAQATAPSSCCSAEDSETATNLCDCAPVQESEDAAEA